MTLCLLVGAGCAPNGSVLAPQEIETQGRHRFESDPSRVFEAAVGALRSQGYTIAFSQRETGLIRTGRRHVGYASIRYPVIPTFRQYQVNVEPLGPGAALVTAVPYLFVGEQNVSSQDYWDVNVERGNWTVLFNDMAQFLAAPSVILDPAAHGL